MPIAQPQYPIRFTPKGLVDSLDATDKFPGACLALTNLVFDQSNPELMVSRPGAASITSFSGITTPGVVSVQITVGTRTYGMISSARNAGKDEPFSYNNDTNTFDTVSGITNANSPTTQPTTGAWTPPTMAVIGTQIIVTHPGFPGGATKFGYFDISTVGSPTWDAGDTATNALPSTPTAVANFANRAYYACGQYLVYSDVLVPRTVTNATQALTIGDTNTISALQGLPVQTSSSGVFQALMVFKAFQVWQVTGDSATSNLLINFLSLTVGTSSPRSIALSPRGLYFASIAGPYFIGQLGNVEAVTNSGQVTDPDIVSPFQNAVTPSRIAGGYSNGIYRVCMETIIRGTQAKNDYWFDERRRRWTGPHSFSYDCASQYSNYFILCSNDASGKLFKSQVIPDAGSAYTDNGVATSAILQSSTFPKTGRMTEKQVIESTIELAAAGQTTSYQIEAQDERETALDTVSVSVGGGGGLWGSFVWGDGTLWSRSTNRPGVYNVPWSLPLVFKKVALKITASSTTALAIGTFFARYQDTGYTNKEPA